MMAQLHPSTYNSAEQESATVAAVVENYCVAVIIPVFNEERHIAEVLGGIPSYVRYIIVVDDASDDGTAAVIEKCAAAETRAIVIHHSRNQGIGGAMTTGFKMALRLEAQIVVKMDGDGQMSPACIASLLEPLIDGDADFSKGNRFHDFSALASMPYIRRLGNVGLSFITKAATGYWTSFDPCNGFIALRREMLAVLDLQQLDHSFFFETSLLSQLYLRNAVIAEVPMPAIYGTEVSHLSIVRVLIQFPPKLAGCFVQRLFFKHVLFNFSMFSIYAISAFVLICTGGLYGGINFISYATAGIPAPTGTVVIPAMFIILGFQFLLAAISEDLRAVPNHPVCRPIRRSAGSKPKDL